MRRHTLGVMTALALGGCTADPGPSNHDPALIPESFWVLSTVVSAGGTLDAKSLPQQPTLSFGLPVGDSTLPVTGFGGCNSFGGQAEVTTSGIRFGPIAITEMFCPGSPSEVERAYVEVLSGSTGYETSGRSLVITGESGARLEFTGLTQ